MSRKRFISHKLYTILFYYGITFFYYYLNRLRSREGEKRLSYAKKALILALVWLPHVLVAYPASIPPDTEAQLMQFMGYEPFTAHHPPAHTYLAGICNKTKLYIIPGVYMFLQSDPLTHRADIKILPFP